MNKKNGSILMMGGLLMVAAALALVCYNVWEEQHAEETSAAVLEEILTEIPTVEAPTIPDDPEEAVIPYYIINPEMDMPVTEVKGQDYIGVLTIPTLGLELPVISEWSYPRLKIAPCRFEGSPYQNDLIIAAHNYKSHFGRLKDLRPGDGVTFTDMDGDVFSYTVAELETLGKGDLPELESGQWDLTLFTCTLGGRTRVVVRCELTEENL